MVVVNFGLEGKVVVDIDIDNHDPSQKSRAAWEELLIGGRFICEHWSHCANTSSVCEQLDYSPALTSSRPGPSVNQSVTTGNFCTYERGSVASMETRRRHRV